MLNFNALKEQFAGFGKYQIQERQRKSIILESALEVFRSFDPDVFQPAAPQGGRPNQLVAVPLEHPKTIYDPSPRPSPLTVVATDGSQIYPDRHVEPLCYLLNLGGIAFQYGTTERPWMEATPHLYFKGQELSSLSGLEIDLSGQEIVSAIRDELELSHLAALAGASRRPARPIVAMADGTLIRWMLKRLQNPVLEQRLLQRYFEALDQFYEQQIPLCSYISMPGNTDFVNYLARNRGTASRHEEGQFEDITDRMVFKEVLLPGQRSATFQSQSMVLQAYPEAQEICYFYIHVAGAGAATEIARVEFPFWMTTNPDTLNLIHATVLSECEKGNGYPMILSEAHEQAVIRSQERYMFYEMIERQMLDENAMMEVSTKKTSKENPVL